jgi:hypothetical protein
MRTISRVADVSKKPVARAQSNVHALSRKELHRPHLIEEQVAEPDFEHLDLGLGHRHLLRPIIRHGPGARIVPHWPARPTCRRTCIVVEIIGCRAGHSCALSSRFLRASHGASVARVANPQNGRSLRGATLWLRSPLTSQRERCRSSEAGTQELRWLCPSFADRAQEGDEKTGLGRTW